MVVERDVLIALLKLTKNGSVLIENVNKDARVASDITLELLEKLQNEDLVYLNRGSVEVDSNNRLRLAVRAVSLGADVERVSGLLCWQEFEEIAAMALRNNQFVVSKNIRFKHEGRRWEMDVVGCKKPIVVCIDCKHYHHGMPPSAMARIAEAQVARTKALAASLPNVAIKMECVTWDKAKFAPAILSLLSSNVRFYKEVPFVPVMQLQDFISQLPAYLGELTCFEKAFRHLRHDS
jgi:Holliday junction resolvase-like predicted endonuclease